MRHTFAHVFGGGCLKRVDLLLKRVALHLRLVARFALLHELRAALLHLTLETLRVDPEGIA